MTIVDRTHRVTGGVDTHLDVHVAAVVDQVGGVLVVESFPTTAASYGRLATWLASFGPVASVGVEGTGSYGAGLARHLASAELDVVEVDRPSRQACRRAGKSDPLDAVSAARAALSGSAAGLPKSRTGRVEAIRVLMVARRSAIDERITTLNQLRHVWMTADDPIRQRFGGLTPAQLLREASALRPRRIDPVRHATLLAIRSLGSGPGSSSARPASSTPRSSRSSSTPRPVCSKCSELASRPRPSSWSPQATTPSGFAARRPGRTCAAWPRCRRRRARRCAAGSAEVATARPIARCIEW